MYYMIVYPQGDRTRLHVGHVRDYEKRDWALASEREFNYNQAGYEEAQEYMKKLADRHGLDYDGKKYLLD